MNARDAAAHAPRAPADEAEARPTVRRAGPFLFISGIAPPAGGDMRSQTEAAIARLRAALEAEGGGLEHMVEVTTYLVSMADFGAYNDVYGAHFSAEGPARTTVAVERLSRPGQRIEMRGTAYLVTSPSET